MTIRRDKNGDFLPGSFKDGIEYMLYHVSEDVDVADVAGRAWVAEWVLEYFCTVVGKGKVPDTRVLEYT
jgi:hypothetical protein